MPTIRSNDPEISKKKGIHLYHFFMSNCAQRVAFTLGEKGLDFVSHPINLLKRENAKPDYFRINPKGLVPAIIHDGVVVTESMDILRYLEGKFPSPSLYPADPQEKKLVDEWMDIATNEHNDVVKTYMYALAFGRSKTPEELAKYMREQTDDPELVEFHRQASEGFSQDQILTAERRLFAFFDRFENELGRHKWLVGDEFTYADIAWFVQYFLMQRSGMVDFSKYPHIRRWASDMMQRPGFARGVKPLQPWYAPIACQILKLRARSRRGGPPLTEPRSDA